RPNCGIGAAPPQIHPGALFPALALAGLGGAVSVVAVFQQLSIIRLGRMNYLAVDDVLEPLRKMLFSNGLGCFRRGGGCRCALDNALEPSGKLWRCWQSLSRWRGALDDVLESCG